MRGLGRKIVSLLAYVELQWASKNRLRFRQSDFAKTPASVGFQIDSPGQHSQLHRDAAALSEKIIFPGAALANPSLGSS
jgi:hypothetical protein